MDLERRFGMIYNNDNGGGGELGICKIFIRKRMERMERIYLLWRQFVRCCVDFSTNQPTENPGAQCERIISYPMSASDLAGRV